MQPPPLLQSILAPTPLLGRGFWRCVAAFCDRYLAVCLIAVASKLCAVVSCIAWVSTHIGYETGHAGVAVQEDGLASEVTIKRPVLAVGAR